MLQTAQWQKLGLGVRGVRQSGDHAGISLYHISAFLQSKRLRAFLSLCTRSPAHLGSFYQLLFRTVIGSASKFSSYQMSWKCRLQRPTNGAKCAAAMRTSLSAC